MREEENNRTSQSSKMQRFFRKRWVFPAIYLASAALILTGVLWFQNSGEQLVDPDQYNYNDTSDVPNSSYNQDEPAVPVTQAVENFAMPVLDPNMVVVQKEFFDLDSTKEEQEAALVFYNNTYRPNTGIDIAKENGESFDVTASLSGTVIKAEKDPIFGNVVEVKHSDGIVTIYQSLSDVQVQKGDTVEQGQVIAKAGQNLYNKEGAVHVHFEIRKNDVPVNPLEFIEKSLTSLMDSEGETDDKASEGNDQSDEETSDEEKDKQDNEEKPDEDPGTSESPDASIGMTTT